MRTSKFDQLRQMNAMHCIMLGLILCSSVGASYKEYSSRAKYAINASISDELNCKEDPDYGATDTCQLVERKGYPCQTLTVQTKDNYILKLHRIPLGNGYNGNSTSKPVMFIQHGLLCASDFYVLNFPHNSIGFMAHDQGYDVWLGNFRGNRYSNKHTRYSTKDPAFFEFGWDEMAQHDLPAMVDKILNETGQQKLFYIGHSMGTTTFMAFLATKPEYNDKIIVAALYSPIATLKHSINPFLAFSPLEKFLPLISFFGSTLGQLFPSSSTIIKFAKEICKLKMLEKTCGHGFKFIFQAGPNLNTSRMCVYMQAIPAGTSTRAAMHYAQMKTSPTFRKYDFGLSNILKYGSLTPPSYDLSKVKIPVALFWSSGDNFNHVKDVQFVQKKLVNTKLVTHIQDTDFGHLDFGISPQAADKVYKPTFDFFQKYK